MLTMNLWSYCHGKSIYRVYNSHGYTAFATGSARKWDYVEFSASVKVLGLMLRELAKNAQEFKT